MTSIKENEKSLGLKNFRLFRGLALHYESAESAEVAFLTYLKKVSEISVSTMDKDCNGT